MLYMQHICQTCIKNVLEAKLPKTTGIKGKLRRKNIRKKKKAITVELDAFRTEPWKSVTLSVHVCVFVYKKCARENTRNAGLLLKL